LATCSGVGVACLCVACRQAELCQLIFFDPEEASSFGEAGRKAVQERIARKKDRIMEKAKAEGRITNDGVEELFCIKR